MTSIRKPFTTLAGAALVAALVGTHANADTIGLNFVATSDQRSVSVADATLASGDVTGVVAAGNWNNSNDGTGLSQDGAIGSLANLTDDTGAATTADATWTATAPFQGLAGMDSNSADQVPTNAFETLFGHASGMPFDGNTSRTYEVDLTDVPYDLYDVYVYVGDTRFSTAEIEIELTPGGGSPLIETATLVGTPGAGFDDATADGTGNYVLFDGITADSFGLDLRTITGNNKQIYGLQIFQVPEPASLALMGLGGLVVLSRRRSA